MQCILNFFEKFKKKWFRSLFLDYFFHDLHLNLLFKNKTEFSNIFFNSIAHIQHHYFYNSEIFDNNQKIQIGTFQKTKILLRIH